MKSNSAAPLSLLQETGYSLAFTLVEGILYCASCPNWACKITKVFHSINVNPDPINRIILYTVTCPDGKMGTFTNEIPSNDEY